MMICDGPRCLILRMCLWGSERNNTNTQSGSIRMASLQGQVLNNYKVLFLTYRSRCSDGSYCLTDLTSLSVTEDNARSPSMFVMMKLLLLILAEFWEISMANADYINDQSRFRLAVYFRWLRW
jgi:hypothetical protein